MGPVRRYRQLGATVDRKQVRSQLLKRHRVWVEDLTPDNISSFRRMVRDTEATLQGREGIAVFLVGSRAFCELQRAAMPEDVLG